MNIQDFINSFGFKDRKQEIRWEIDPAEGVDFIYSQKAINNPAELAIKNPLFGMQLAYLNSLDEQGLAEINNNGFTIKSETIADLEDQFFELFGLPPSFTGTYKARIEGNTGQTAFNVSIDLLMADGAIVTHYQLFGPFLKVSEKEIFRLTPSEWRAFNTLKQHSILAVSDRTEYENNWLMFQLDLAQNSGMRIDLGHFNNLDLSRPENIGVAVEQLENGDLALTPTYGSGIPLPDIQKRLGQVSDNDENCILRVNNRLILLDNERVKATHEILTNQKIPKDQVKNFLSSPSAYLSASLIDLDTGFSLRAHGAERFTHRYFGDIEKSNVNWFAAAEPQVEPVSALGQIIDSKEALDEVKQAITDAQKNNSDALEYEGRSFDLSDISRVDNVLQKIKQHLVSGKRENTFSTDEDEDDDVHKGEKAVLAIDANDENIDFINDLKIDDVELESQNFNQKNLKRSPFSHQDEGIRWLLSHFELSTKNKKGSGALLADDMGLGKTYMVLVAIAEWFERIKHQGNTQKPCLIVAPLGLIENWLSEIDDTFKQSPFADIVSLQAGADLNKYKIKGGKRETEQRFDGQDVISEVDQIRYSLKVGKGFGSDRLDMPGRLVLTTYQTLRDYQFSLSRVDWSIAAFDEAQNLKNPNTLSTIAAKALKTDMKLLATGTPVENTLKDFWCLMDTAKPGLLGAWKTFRQEFIVPILAASNEDTLATKIEMGRSLRNRVGDFMLRRTKAEKLKGLPEKYIYSGDQNHASDIFLPALAATISGEQLSKYNQIVSDVNQSDVDKRSIILPSLHKLKIASIHQDLCDTFSAPSSAKDLLKQAEASSKIKSMLGILQEIKRRKEKVLIFATTKSVQAYISALVGTLFKTQVQIINGETNAMATKSNQHTRKSIIDEFQNTKGFGAIIMSPVAAGVGLTVVGANNVIHLERHWNPAKEAQATDRVYRIGQEKPVNVYLPMALHPELASFDLHLNKLLANKVDLSDAVVAPEEVDASNMQDIF